MKTETFPNTEAIVSPEIPSVKSQEAPLSPQAELAMLAEKSNEFDSRLDTLAASKDDTVAKLAAVREKLGLPPLAETPPSLQHLEEKMQKIENEKSQVAERQKELLSAEEKEKLVAIEKVRLMNEEVAKMKSEFLSLAPDMQSIIIATGRIPEGAVFHLPPGMGSIDSVELKTLVARVLEDEPLTEEDLEKKPEALAALEKDAEEAATEHIDTAVAHLRDQSPDVLTDIDKQVLREADELLIGYEGDSYTPEALLSRVEEQNRQAEAAPSASAAAAETYNPTIQAN
jgi:hypothetical protein